MVVRDLFVPGKKCWNKTLLEEMFVPEVADMIANSALIDAVKEDRRVWWPNNKVAKDLCEVKVQRFARILWSIWRARNLKLWEEIDESASQIYQRAIHRMEDWRSANIGRNMSGNRNSYRDSEQWRKPLPGTYKCNLDAAFFHEDNKTAMSACLRDDQGKFILARTEWCSPMMLVHEGEAAGLLKALHWVAELNLEFVTFELDCKLVVDQFKSTIEDISEFGTIISQCKELLMLNTNFSVKFIRRQGNVVAHSLARAATILPSPHIYHCIPDCIELSVLNEMK